MARICPLPRVQTPGNLETNLLLLCGGRLNIKDPQVMIAPCRPICRAVGHARPSPERKFVRSLVKAPGP